MIEKNGPLQTSRWNMLKLYFVPLMLLKMWSQGGCGQGRRANSDALGQKRRTKAPAREMSRKFSGPRNYLWKLLLVYCMRPPDLEALDVVKPFGR